jgi:hypothetical protein
MGLLVAGAEEHSQLEVRVTNLVKETRFSQTEEIEAGADCLLASSIFTRCLQHQTGGLAKSSG